MDVAIEEATAYLNEHAEDNLMGEAQAWLDSKAKQRVKKRRRKTKHFFINGPQRDDDGYVLLKNTGRNKKKGTGHVSTVQADGQQTIEESGVATDDTLDELIHEVLQDLPEDTGEDKSYQTWQHRREVLENKWDTVREALSKNVILRQAPTLPVCNKCNNDSTIRCYTCLPYAHLCADCDREVHDEMFGHTRMCLEDNILRYIPNNMFLSGGSLHTKAKFLPLLCLGSCFCESPQLGQQPYCNIAFINMEGRHEAMLPEHVCLSCQSIVQTPTLDLIVQSNYWPGHPKLQANMYIFDDKMIHLYHKLKMECPGLSTKGFLAAVMKNHSADQHKTINATLFMDAVREWEFAQYNANKLKGEESMVCPPCSKKMHAVHIDGNRKVYRYSYNDSTARANLYGSAFISEDNHVDHFVKRIQNLKSKNVSSNCGESHWKAARATSKMSAKIAETGLCVAVCRHGLQLKAINMFQGEIFAYPMYLQYYFFNQPNIFFCQDIVCKYWPYLKDVVGKSADDPVFQSLNRQTPFLSIMHAKAHEWKCQIRWGGRNKLGAGATTGEEGEQTNSYLSKCGVNTKIMTKSGREEQLTNHVLHWNAKKLNKMPLTLPERFAKANKKLDSARNELDEKLDSIPSGGVIDITSWQSELLKIAESSSNTIVPATKYEEVYILHQKIALASQLTTIAQMENADIQISAAFGVHMKAKVAVQDLQRLKVTFHELKGILQLENPTKPFGLMLQEGRDEALASLKLKLQTDIECSGSSLRAANHMWNSADSGKKKSRCRAKSNRERSKLENILKEYNNCFSADISIETVLNEVLPWTTEGVLDVSLKQSVVESFNKVQRFEEELDIVKRECKDMIMYYKNKIINLNAIYDSSEDTSERVAASIGLKQFKDLLHIAAVSCRNVLEGRVLNDGYESQSSIGSDSESELI